MSWSDCALARIAVAVMAGSPVSGRQPSHASPRRTGPLLRPRPKLLPPDALVGELLLRLVGLRAIELHAAQHLRRLGELDVRIGDHLDAVAPRIEEVEERPLQQARTGGLGKL